MEANDMNMAKIEFNYVALAMSLREAKRLEEAEMVLRIALSGLHDNFSIRLTLGLILQEEEKNNEALTLLMKLFEENPNEKVLYKVLGKVYLNIGDWNKCIKTLEKYVSYQEEESAEIYTILASAYIQERRINKARKWISKALELEPCFEEANCLMADALRISKNYIKAEEILLQILERSSVYFQAIIGMGKIFNGKGEIEKAIEWFEKAITVDSNNPQPYSELGNIYHNRKRSFSKAIKYYTKAIKINDNSPIFYCNRANSYISTEQYEKAKKDIARAIRINTDYQRAYILSGILHFKNGEYQEAIKMASIALKKKRGADAFALRGAFYSQIKDFDSAIKDFDEALKFSPKNMLYLGAKGEAYSMKKDYHMAIEVFNRILEIEPNSQLSFMSYCSRGKAYMNMKEHLEEAETDFTKAIDLNPKVIEIYHLRSDIYKEKKDFEKAIADLDIALNLSPNNYTSLIKRALVCNEADKYELAIADLSKAKGIEPNTPNAYLLSGIVYFKMAAFNQGIKDLNKFIELDPYSPLGFLYRGRIYRRLYRYEDALNDFKKAVLLEPENLEALANIGNIYRLSGRDEEAFSELNTTIQKNPGFAWAYGLRGDIYSKQKRFENALEDLSKALEIDPNYGWILSKRAEIYLDLHKYQEALEDINKALNETPSSWNYYIRSLIWISLGRLDEWEIDINQAVSVAEKEYESQPDNFVNAFNLALHYLCVGKVDKSLNLYKKLLSETLPDEVITESILDLKSYSLIFPANKEAKELALLLEDKQNIGTSGITAVGSR